MTVAHDSGAGQFALTEQTDLIRLQKECFTNLTEAGALMEGDLCEKGTLQAE